MKLGEWFAGKLANFNGQMSEFSVWNTALTTAQINDYMTQSLDGDETNLTGYWRLDEGPGTTINDQTTNNNDGTLAGNTTWVDTAPDILGSTVQLAEGTSASGRMTGVGVTGTPTYAVVTAPTNGTTWTPPTASGPTRRRPIRLTAPTPSPSRPPAPPRASIRKVSP